MDFVTPFTITLSEFAVAVFLPHTTTQSVLGEMENVYEFVVP